jgi:large subunit ribosomal protein L31
MQKGIHPEYMDTAVSCGCGNSFTTRSTVEKLVVEICSACHPFYTGQMKYVDSAGRVEKFQKKYNWGKKAEEPAEAEAETEPAAEAAAEE